MGQTDSLGISLVQNHLPTKAFYSLLSSGSLNIEQIVLSTLSRKSNNLYHPSSTSRLEGQNQVAQMTSLLPSIELGWPLSAYKHVPPGPGLVLGIKL